MTMNEGAKRLGESLLKEVKVDDLSSIFNVLRVLGLSENERTTCFGIPELDALLSFPPEEAAAIAATDQDPLQPYTIQDDSHWRSDPSSPSRPPLQTPKSKFTAPVLELISPSSSHHPSNAGKTSLLYLIIAYAILPPKFHSTSLGGQNAAVVLFDPLSHFRETRLVQVMLNVITSSSLKEEQEKEQEQEQEQEQETACNQNPKPNRQAIKSLIQQSLLHLHILRPQSWPSLLSTLTHLPTYLFSSTRHRSNERRLHSIILDDIDVFVPNIRSSPTNATTLNTITPLTTGASTSNMAMNSLQGASNALISHLSHLSTLLSCATVLTSHSIPTANSSSSSSSSSHAFRSFLPASWPPGTPLTRLAVRRVEVLKFAPGISIQEAENERQERWEVLSRGRFECWRVGGGGSGAAREMTTTTTRGSGTKGFLFRVGSESGVEIERLEEKRGEQEQGRQTGGSYTDAARGDDLGVDR